MAVVLDHAEQRDVQPESVEHGLYGADLPGAAVQEDQIGQSAEALAAVFVFFILVEAARKHFVHGTVVVVPFKGFDDKASICGF